MSPTNVTERPDECEAKSCNKDPQYELAYTEVSPNTYSWYCSEHKNMEQIHDPVNTKIVTEPWEIDS